MPEKLIDVHEVAKTLGVSPRKVWEMRDSGYMPKPIKLGGAVRWRAEADINQWLAAGCPDCRGNERRGQGRGRA